MNKFLSKYKSKFLYKKVILTLFIGSDIDKMRQTDTIISGTKDKNVCRFYGFTHNKLSLHC